MTDYSTTADAYARNRRTSEHVIAEIRSFCCLTSTSRVLEVGCGTANHIRALIDATGCAGWGIEPSEAMRRRARCRARLSISAGSAESIPFDDEFFCLLFSVNVIHHVTRPERYFDECFRVLRPQGLVCTFTDSTEMIMRREPLSRYWPASVEADIARYHSVEALVRFMDHAGFVDVNCREINRASRITDASPYREKAYSCLRLIDDSQFNEGLQELEEDLQKGPVRWTSEYACIWGKKPDSKGELT